MKQSVRFETMFCFFSAGKKKKSEIVIGFKRKDVTNRMEHDKFLTMR